MSLEVDHIDTFTRCVHRGMAGSGSRSLASLRLQLSRHLRFCFHSPPLCGDTDLRSEAAILHVARVRPIAMDDARTIFVCDIRAPARPLDAYEPHICLEMSHFVGLVAERCTSSHIICYSKISLTITIDRLVERTR